VNRCLALGPWRDLARSAVLDPAGWHPVPGATIPPLPPQAVLIDVSCTPSMCLVVGGDGTSPVAYRWAF
jgi:hypothetical protein